MSKTMPRKANRAAAMMATQQIARKARRVLPSCRPRSDELQPLDDLHVTATKVDGDYYRLVVGCQQVWYSVEDRQPGLPDSRLGVG